MAEVVGTAGRLPERTLAKRALERGADAFSRELALLAEEPDDAVEIRLRRPHLEHISDVGLEEDAAHLVDRRLIPERPPDLLRHVLDAAVPLHQRQRLLRADAFDPLIEIGAHEHREIHEPLAADAPAVEQPIELDG